MVLVVLLVAWSCVLLDHCDLGVSPNHHGFGVPPNQHGLVFLLVIVVLVSF